MRELSRHFLEERNLLLLEVFLFVLSGVRPTEAMEEVKAVELTVADLRRSKSFFEDVLEFKEAASSKNSVRESEFVVLTQYASAAPMSEHRLAANATTLFQHLAIVASNMDFAFQNYCDLRWRSCPLARSISAIQMNTSLN